MDATTRWDVSSGPEPAPKRRKIRKGTQSCWECKRRKARCTFSAGTQEVCEGCKRRGTDCIRQDLTDRPPPPGSNKHIVDRLGQVEALVGQLLKVARSNEDVGAAQSRSRHRLRKRVRGSSGSPMATPKGTATINSKPHTVCSCLEFPDYDTDML